MPWSYPLFMTTLDQRGKLKKIDQNQISTCIGENVLIETPEGKIKIKNLVSGQEILGYDLKKKKLVKTKGK